MLARRAKTAEFAFPGAPGKLRQLLDVLNSAQWQGQAEILSRILPQYMAHQFNLLGSGWVKVGYGEGYAGFGPHRYGPGSKLPADWRTAMIGQAWPRHRGRAGALLAMISSGYAPVDWQVDFKSGWRWDAKILGPASRIGPSPGADIKVPWELARLQHLPALAGGYALAGQPGFGTAASYMQEFQDLLLDFMVANPPAWGVNWACPMDVAIRAANIVLAWNLFRALGAEFSPAFENILASSLLAHGRYVFTNLEWHGGARANHYLANIAGLAFVAAALAGSDETDHWLDFAARELEREILFQFLPDGGNFEGSTAYHGLSGEMAIYAAALLAGQGRIVGAASRSRLAAAVKFSHAITRPDGAIVQIGDNDSGRFFKLTPAFDPDGEHEIHLSQSGFQGAASGLFAASGDSLDAVIVHQLAGGVRFSDIPSPRQTHAVAFKPLPAQRAVRVVIRAPLEAMHPEAFADFGLYIWRNPRDFISIRCGRAAHDAHGAHAHNDQLSMEICLNGVFWARDPGSYIYTADLQARKEYRRTASHFAPRGDRETGDISAGPFRLHDHAAARMYGFGPREFIGAHDGFGDTVFRRVRLEDAALVIEDTHGGTEITPTTVVTEHSPASPRDLAQLWGLTLPFSPGYGLQDADSSLSK